jgi:hypothetical protein
MPSRSNRLTIRTSVVFLKSAMNSLTRLGMTMRIACGRTIRPVAGQ